MKKNNLSQSYRIVPAIIFWALLFPGCNGTTGSRQKNQKEITPVTRPLSKPGSSYNDTLLINTPSAIFYNPDSIQLEKIKAVNKETVAESMVHDCFYQMRNARIVLKKYWPQIRIIETSKARYLLFAKKNQSKTYIDLNSKNDMCGIFLFDPQKEPEFIDMMNIDTALEFYFKK